MKYTLTAISLASVLFASSAFAVDAPKLVGIETVPGPKLVGIDLTVGMAVNRFSLDDYNYNLRYTRKVARDAELSFSLDAAENGTTLNHTVTARLARNFSGVDVGAAAGEKFNEDGTAYLFWAVDANVPVPVTKQLTLNVGELKYRRGVNVANEAGNIATGIGVDYKITPRTHIAIDATRNMTQDLSLTGNDTRVSLGMRF